MNQCFQGLNNSVIWSGDFTFEDMGYEGEGLFTSAIVLIVERKSNTAFRLM